jgi:hypothetical protein
MFFPQAIVDGDAPPVDIHQVIMGGLLLIGLIILGMVAAKWVRGWAKRDEDIPLTGFTPEDLRKLHREGKMTEEEYKLASSRVFGKLKNQILAPKDGEDGKRNPPDTKLPKPPGSPRSPRPPRHPLT